MDYVGTYHFAEVNATISLTYVKGLGEALILNGVPNSAAVQLQPLMPDSFMMAYGPLPHNCGSEWGGSLQIVTFQRGKGGNIITATLPGLAYGQFGIKTNP